jgi:hypothetical protein
MSAGERQRHTPSGRFDRGTLLVRGLFGLGLAALLACGLAWLTTLDAYAVGLLTLVPILTLSSWAQRTTRAAKCRNPFVVALAAGGLGAFVMLAHFHIDQCRRWGVAWKRLDRLPGFVAFRMETDGWWVPNDKLLCRAPEPANPAIAPWRVPVPAATMSWVVLLAELLGVGLIPAAAGWRAAVRPFDEAANDWCVRDRVFVTPESARLLQEALATDALAEWTRTGFERSATGGKRVAVDVWYTPRRSGQNPTAAGGYLGVGDQRPVRLTPEEAAALTVLLPEVGTLAAVPEELESGDTIGAVDPDLARLIRVPGKRVGWAKDLRVKYLGRVLMFGVATVPLFVLFALAGLAMLLHELGIEGLPLMLIIMPLALGQLVFTLRYWFHPANSVEWRFLVWYYRSVIRREARGRADALFPADDGRAMYVEMIPRRAWSDISGQAHACEGGLLLIDEPSSRLLFEGDRYRYVIPFAAIEEIAFEEIIFHTTESNAGTVAGFYAVVVTVRVRGGSRELPLCPTANVPGRNRYEKATAFYTELTAVVGAYFDGLSAPEVG